jgi:hypothetical protein
MPVQFWVAVYRAVIRDGLLEESGAVDPAAMSRWHGGNSCLMKKIQLVLHNCDAFFASHG